jgi:FkbM family methyltransferase
MPSAPLLSPEQFADRPLVVVDVGARWGVGEAWADLAPHVRVYGFDPDPEECARLNALAEDPTTTYVPVALGDAARTATLHVTRQPACSSLYPPLVDLVDTIPVLADITPVGEQQVELQTLDGWCAAEGLGYVDVLKVDTQGSELDVLKGAAGILPTVSWIEVEVEFNPIYEGQPLFGDVDRFLRGHGFVLWRLDDLMHYTDGRDLPRVRTQIDIAFDTDRRSHDVGGGQLYWAQAFFVRAEHTRPATGTERPAALRAAAVATAAGFPDLAVRVLPELADALAAPAAVTRAERRPEPEPKLSSQPKRQRPPAPPPTAARRVRTALGRVARKLRRRVPSR